MFMTVEEIAAQLRVSPRTVYRLVERGRLRAVRVGDLYRITMESFSAFLASGGGPDDDLTAIRNRNRVDRINASSDGWCMICASFDGFSEGAPKQSHGTAYHPPERAPDEPGHVHRFHQIRSVEHIQEDAALLRQEVARLEQLYPAEGKAIGNERERLSRAVQGPASRVMERLSDIAANLIHVRRLAEQGDDRIGIVADPEIR
jgi:excisionase family DNA binding protein